MKRSLLWTLLLTATVAGAELPRNVRLPVVEWGTTHYERYQLVSGLYSFSAALRPRGPDSAEPARPIVLLWEDGRVLWSEDAVAGGPPYRTGFVPVARVQALTERFKSANPALLTRESLGPDASYATLFLALGGGYAQMKSWHPRAPNAETVATSHGLEARKGRDPAVVLAADAPDYQAFRRTWRELEEELFALAHAATGPTSVAAKFEWDWSLPPGSGLSVGKPLTAPRLQMRLELVEGRQWRFVIEEMRFGTVEQLRHFLVQQKPGTVLTWDPGCKRLGNEPLLSSESEMAAFKAFCVQHGIELVILPSG